MDDPGYSEQMASIACMVQSLSDQFAAYQRDHPGTDAPDDGRRLDAAAAADVAELTTRVVRLQRDLEDMRTQLRTEVRTRAIVVDDGARKVTILPGEIMVERFPTSGDVRSGSTVHIQSLVRGAEVRVGAAFRGRDDPGVSAIINANWEGHVPCALVSAQVDAADGHDEQEELRVEDGSATNC